MNFIRFGSPRRISRSRARSFRHAPVTAAAALALCAGLPGGPPPTRAAEPSATVPKNVTPPSANTWESIWPADQRAKFDPLLRTYMCLSADPPPECFRRKSGEPLDPAAEEDLLAAQREAYEQQVWDIIKEAWPNIGFTAEQVDVIRGRAEFRLEPEAFEMLGYMYQNGQGVPKDSVDAFKSYRKAYVRGRRTAGPALAEVWRSLNTAQKTELNTWLKSEGGDGAAVKGRELGPPKPMGGG